MKQINKKLSTLEEEEFAFKLIAFVFGTFLVGIVINIISMAIVRFFFRW